MRLVSGIFAALCAVIWIGLMAMAATRPEVQVHSYGHDGLLVAVWAFLAFWPVLAGLTLGLCCRWQVRP